MHLIDSSHEFFFQCSATLVHVTWHQIKQIQYSIRTVCVAQSFTCDRLSPLQSSGVWFEPTTFFWQHFQCVTTTPQYKRYKKSTLSVWPTATHHQHRGPHRLRHALPQLGRRTRLTEPAGEPASLRVSRHRHPALQTLINFQWTAKKINQKTFKVRFLQARESPRFKSPRSAVTVNSHVQITAIYPLLRIPGGSKSPGSSCGVNEALSRAVMLSCLCVSVCERFNTHTHTHRRVWAPSSLQTAAHLRVLMWRSLAA